MDVKLEGFFLRPMQVNDCMSVMPHVGCRFVVVDSKHSSLAFYQRAGFVLLDIPFPLESDLPVMFFDLAKATCPFETTITQTESELNNSAH